MSDTKFNQISKFYDFPIYEAAASLGMSVNEVKNICRENNLKRWPYHTSKRRCSNSLFMSSKISYFQSSKIPTKVVLPSFQSLVRSIEELKNEEIEKEIKLSFN